MARLDSAKAASRGAKKRGSGFTKPKGWTADHTCYGHPEWTKAECDAAKRRAKERSTAAAARG